MTEDEFWGRLEFRIPAEFVAVVKPPYPRGWWCDGFIPDEPWKGWGDITPPSERDYSRTTGQVWMVDGQQQQLWTFVLEIRNPPSQQDPDWARLLPAADESGWLSVDAGARHLTIVLEAR